MRDPVCAACARSLVGTEWFTADNGRAYHKGCEMKTAAKPVAKGERLGEFAQRKAESAQQAKGQKKL